MINFSNISGKSILGKILHFLFRFIPPNTTFFILQGRLRSKRWIVSSDVMNSYWLGCYEYEKQILFSKIVHKGAVVYDIGAYVGFYTLLASELVGQKGRVFAFEPLPKNLYYLKRHLQLNCCSNVTVIETAVGEKDTIVFFEEGIERTFSRVSGKGNLKVKMISLDDFVLRDKNPPPEYLKIDVEGSELSVFIGAEKTLSYYKPVIFLSCHSLDLKNRCCEFLESIGYNKLQTLMEGEGGYGDVLAIHGNNQF